MVSRVNVLVYSVVLLVVSWWTKLVCVVIGRLSVDLNRFSVWVLSLSMRVLGVGRFV